jgi:hypothetical protein
MFARERSRSISLPTENGFQNIHVCDVALFHFIIRERKIVADADWNIRRHFNHFSSGTLLHPA